MKTRGRRVAWRVAGVGLVVLLVAGYAAKDRILEERWLCRLEDGDERAQELADIIAKVEHWGLETNVWFRRVNDTRPKMPHAFLAVQEATTHGRFVSSSVLLKNHRDAGSEVSKGQSVGICEKGVSRLLNLVSLGALELADSQRMA